MMHSNRQPTNMICLKDKSQHLLEIDFSRAFALPGAKKCRSRSSSKRRALSSVSTSACRNGRDLVEMDEISSKPTRALVERELPLIRLCHMCITSRPFCHIHVLSSSSRRIDENSRVTCTSSRRALVGSTRARIIA